MRIGAKHWTGLSRGKSAKDFCPKALRQGTKVEMEHTMDHLTEDPRYYDKLARMEKGR
jgi:hypothetical protein